MNWQQKIIDGLISGPYGELQYLIHYGGTKGSDDDFVAIYKDFLYSSWLLAGRLDFFAICDEQFFPLMMDLDPVATEPLLTGTLCYGDPDSYQEIIDELNNQEATSKITKRLLNCSLSCKTLCKERIANNALTPDGQMTPRLLAGEAMFSLGYLCLAHAYKKHTSPMCIEDAIALLDNEKITALWNQGKENKRNNQLPEKWMNEVLDEAPSYFL